MYPSSEMKQKSDCKNLPVGKKKERREKGGSEFRKNRFPVGAKFAVRTGLGIVAELYRCDPSPGGCYRISSILAFCPYFRAKMPFFGQNSQKKSAQKWSKNGPKVVKNGQNCPKIGEIICGGPPENPNESQKYRK